MSQSNEPLVRHSLANLVYDRLLDSILSGALASDADINVSDIAKELGVSPIPVREALVRLSTEGLVETSANRRARVVHISRQDVVAVFQVRQILESGAASLAAGCINDEQLKELEDLVENRTELYHEGPGNRAVLDLDNEFHLLIAEIAGNELLAAEIARYNHRVRVIQWLRQSEIARDVKTTDAEHQQILAALRSRDSEGARAKMSEHIGRALERILKVFDETDESEE